MRVAPPAGRKYPVIENIYAGPHDSFAPKNFSPHYTMQSLTNVDPSSTLQVVHALIKANKQFDLLVMPGEEHGGGRRGPSAPYGDRWLWDFFVRHLRGEPTPDWNTIASEATTPTGTPLTTSPASAATFGASWDQILAGWDTRAPY